MTHTDRDEIRRSPRRSCVGRTYVPTTLSVGVGQKYRVRATPFALFRTVIGARSVIAFKPFGRTQGSVGTTKRVHRKVPTCSRDKGWHGMGPSTERDTKSPKRSFVRRACGIKERKKRIGSVIVPRDAFCLVPDRDRRVISDNV